MFRAQPPLVSLHLEGYISPDPENPDRVLALLTPEATFLYREEEGGNRFPTSEVMESLEIRAVRASEPLGTVQVSIGGVPEVVVLGKPALDDDRVARIAEELEARGVVPSGTPVYAMREGRAVDMGRAGPRFLTLAA